MVEGTMATEMDTEFAANGSSPVKAENSNNASRKPKEYEPTSIVVTHIPADKRKKEIEDFFSEVGRVRSCHLVRDKDWQFRGMVYVQYTRWEDAAKAKETLNRKLFGGASLRIKFSRNKKKEKEKEKKKKRELELKGKLNDEHYDGDYEEKPAKKRFKKDRSKYDVNKEARKMRKGRIIVRNLSFKINEKLLEEHFAPYGKLNEVKIVRKEDNKLAGYAFLQYETKIEAMKAIQHCNMKPLLGRPVVVDLAVPKNVFASQNVKQEDEDIKEEVVDVKEETDGDSVPKMKPLEMNYSDIKIKDEKLSDDDDDEDDSGVEEHDESDNDESDMEDDDDEDEDDDDDEEESEEEEESKPKRKPVVTNNPSTDVTEERSVFIKNLNFDATEEDISSVLSEFGPLKYVIICMDPLTERPRGTAFAQFKSAEGVKACLAAESDPSTKSQFVVLGRPMHIMKAVSRGNLEDRRKEESEKKVKDNRNLYLAKEGFVRSGTAPAVGVSAADMNLRNRREQVKRRMLKNLNIFVSTTRLCVNNLPENYTDYQLRKLFSKRGGEGCFVTEARVMKNLQELDSDGKPKSKNYGFVAFTEHKHALQALRTINNNPDIFTASRRPVVEFSMENREILRAREKRLVKSKEKNPTWQKKAETAKQNEYEGKFNKQTNASEVSQSEVPFMGSKSDPTTGTKNALTSKIGEKVRQRDGGKITRKQLKKQRKNLQNKKTKRLKVLDNSQSFPVAKKLKEDGTAKKNNKKAKPLPKSFRTELRNDKSFNDMVQKYKQKMSTANSGSSTSKRWYED